MRDLFSWLLVYLGLVDATNRSTLLRLLTEIGSHMTSIHVPDTLQLRMLMRLRAELSELLMVLLRLSTKHTVHAAFNRQQKPSPAVLSSVLDESLTSGSEEVEEHILSVLSAIKDLVSAAKGTVAVSVYEDERSTESIQALDSYRQLRGLLALHNLRHLDEHTFVASLRKPACQQVLHVLNHALANSNAGAQPVNSEAQRQLLFFCNSLRNRSMPRPISVREMRSWSSFTPHYEEDVSYSESTLKMIGDDDVNLERLFQASICLSAECTYVERVISFRMGAPPAHVLDVRSALLLSTACTCWMCEFS